MDSPEDGGRCAIAMISCWICSRVFPPVGIPSLLAASIRSWSPVFGLEEGMTGCESAGLVPGCEGCCRAAAGAGVGAGEDGWRKGLVPFWIPAETFWNSLDALSNSLLAWATILASSGIFCGPHRKKTKMIAAMLPSSKGSKANLAFSGRPFLGKSGTPILLRLAGGSFQC